MTPSQRAKQGGIKLTVMAEILDYSRPHLYTIFNENPVRFDLMLFDAMRKKCESDILNIKLNNSVEGKGE